MPAEPIIVTEAEWIEYIARRRNEGWRWGWERNDQLKTDPLMWTTPIAIETIDIDVPVWAERYKGDPA